MLKMIIADSRPDLLAIWSKVFSSINRVFFINADNPTLMQLPEVDAELMRGVFAHERYGGTPKPGESQILSSKGEVGVPPWLITTAPFAAHIEKVYLPDGTIDFQIVQNENLTPEEEEYIVFKKAFECIEKFNTSHEVEKIGTLGFHLWFLNIPRGDPIKEAEACRTAYLEFYNET
jgi:hypothetical protein